MVANQGLLDKAIEALALSDICISSCHCEVSEEFEPKFLDEVEEIPWSHRHVVDRSQIIEFEDAAQTKAFRIYIDFGVRWLPEKLADDLTEEEFEAKTLAKIEATYIAEYLLTGDLEQEALREFALHNASFHVWPFWREYLMTQCTRMNLPRVMLPMRQVASNSEVAGASD